ncbi:MAG TPA: hypothetical protein DIT01_20290 [Lentisphaeria bacterium]|nr:hypothetical protein [Lentisphaeria bacterium]
MLGEIEKIVAGVSIAGNGFFSGIGAIGKGGVAMTVAAQPKTPTTEQRPWGWNCGTVFLCWDDQ